MKRSLAVLLLLAGCGSAKVQLARPSIVLSGDVVTYRGHILRDSAEQFRSVIGDQPVRRLRIASGGGDVRAAIAIARWVFDRQVDVEVTGACFSSCANYIFPAGREKYITGSGVVGWHGTIEHRVYQHRHGIRKASEPEMKHFEPTAAAEREFYAATGVNGYMSWFGKLAPYKVYDMYIMSKEDMAYFGLAALHVPDDYVAASLKAWNRNRRNTLTLVAVDRSVTNPSDPNWVAAVKGAQD